MDFSQYVIYYPGATDVHLTEGAPVMVRVKGKLIQMSHVATSETFDKIIQDYFSLEKKREYEEKGTTDTSFTRKNVRYRFHLYRVFGKRAAALRILPPLSRVSDDPDEKWIRYVAGLSSGLVLVTGTTGSGKTTALARIIEEINRTKPLHIITLEDPVEYTLSSRKALIHQREKEKDFSSFDEGIRSALREDPDVIVVGEMRDRETIRAALTAAETGHLVLATLHTRRAVDAISRIVHAFDPAEQGEVRYILSSVLKSVAAQMIFKGKGDPKLIREILVMNPAISHLVREGKDEQIISYMGHGDGMTGTFEHKAELAAETMNDEDAAALMKEIKD